jgi:5-methylcytosine-specific restriction enzyme subunit McrC
MREPLVLREYESGEVELDHAAAMTLRRQAGNALLLSTTDDPDRWMVRAGSQVGTVVTADTRVLIRPKVTDANLFHLLEVDGDPIDPGAELFDYASGDLVPAFATFFVRHLERALGRGLRRSYVEVDEWLSGIRGRVDLRTQVMAGGLPLPVACRYDEHTPDTQLNRILLGATVRLTRLPGVTVMTRRALLALCGKFEDVGGVTPSDLARPTTFTRLDEHFRPVERLARLVLERSSLLDRVGAAGAATFVVDMFRLFEQFVEARLRRYLRDRLEVRGQAPATLDVGGHVHMRPDLVFRRAGVNVYVADSKYKLTTTGFGREADYYQLLAYCTALGLGDGMLIYCHDEDEVPPKQVLVRGSAGTRLSTHAVRLDGTPADVDARLASLADTLAERVDNLVPVGL